MADKIPLKAIPASGDATALQEFEAGDTNGVAHGGTGKTTIAADKFWYASALDTLSEASITTAGLAILDDADAAAQRTTLGLGTAATQNTGTSGANVPLLSTANTWTLVQDFSAAGAYIGGATADNLLNAYDLNLNWTPTFTCVTPGDLTIVYSDQIGRARQIGNRIDFNLRITTSTFTHTTASGKITISLPVTAEATPGNNSACSTIVGPWTAPANYTQLESKVIAGTATAELRGVSNVGAAIVATLITEFVSGSNVVIEIAGSYEV